MALVHCHFFSEVLGLSTSINVILPRVADAEDRPPLEGWRRRYPTLTLLHGLSDDHTIWLRRTAIERYVQPLQLAVVMPAVHRSFYTDMAIGYKYWTFVSEELPAITRSYFPLSAAREDNFVAGLSMGGYGAFKLGLAHPDRYAAAASLSGAVDMAERAGEVEDPGYRREMEIIFGGAEQIAGSQNDLRHLARQVAASSGPKPLLYQCCGTEDFLYDDNVRFRDFLRTLDLDLRYDEGPGEHEWSYWDYQIQQILDWLPIRRDGEDENQE
jgi:S-formylglutathione hydrolase FrmB